MPTTRSQAHKEEEVAAPSADDAQPGSKHKTAEGAGLPQPKRAKKTNEKGQKTIEETIAGEKGQRKEDVKGESPELKQQNAETKKEAKERKIESNKPQAEKQEEDNAGPGEEAKKPSSTKDTTTPSNILEKGIIYFFLRSRVDTSSSPSNMSDVARSYILLRPSPSTRFTHTPLPDTNTNRLCLIPKRLSPNRPRPGPEYPKKFLEEFKSLRWAPTQPKHLDYVNTQFLMVGESSGVEKALEPQEEDEKEGKKEPGEEMEELEEEDAKRMNGLSDDDSAKIYADLQVDAEDYPKLQTTF
ncbi:hypothetical protein N0V88_006566 [Collariella sp. IMI 366227]|nr:hypothetical protein N0V88_006566 [Collariella sp. IMI 366227]